VYASGPCSPSGPYPSSVRGCRCRRRRAGGLVGKRGVSRSAKWTAARPPNYGSRQWPPRHAVNPLVSQDRRPDRQQLSVGSSMTRDGFPVVLKVFLGPPWTLNDVSGVATSAKPLAHHLWTGWS
jgi:hypothetical protein